MNREWLIAPLAVLSTLEISKWAFSWKTRQEIKERAGYTSEISGRDDLPLECSHFNHSRDYEYYDDPTNGIYVTIYEHLAIHQEAGRHRTQYGLLPNGLTKDQNLWAINKIRERINEYERSQSLQPVSSFR